MTPRACSLGLMAALVITLIASASAGAAATLSILTGRPTALVLLGGHLLIIAAGLWLIRRWLLLLVAVSQHAERLAAA